MGWYLVNVRRRGKKPVLPYYFDEVRPLFFFFSQLFSHSIVYKKGGVFVVCVCVYVNIKSGKISLLVPNRPSLVVYKIKVFFVFFFLKEKTFPLKSNSTVC